MQPMTNQAKSCFKSSRTCCACRVTGLAQAEFDKRLISSLCRVVNTQQNVATTSLRSSVVVYEKFRENLKLVKNSSRLLSMKSSVTCCAILMVASSLLGRAVEVEVSSMGLHGILPHKIDEWSLI